jgi:hypothetical protein
MKHYINNTTKEVFAYEADGSQDDYIQDGLVAITDADLAALRAEQKQALQDALTYSDQRAKAYPTIQEQLDMQYWDGVNGTTIWADTVASVKSENPKP